MKKISIALFFIILAFLPGSRISAQTYYVDFDSLSSGMTSAGAYVLSLYDRDSLSDDTLYAGGHFTIAGRANCRNIAQWIDSAGNGYLWHPLGTGVNNNVCAITSWNNYLYAGGKFDTAGGIAASHIAKWNISTRAWDSLKGQLNGTVYALCVYHNALYVGGDFTIAGGDTVNRIAVWKDSVWASAGKGFDTGAVYALTVSNDTLYAGGSFLKSDGKTLNHVAKWNGAYWDSLGKGTNNTVYALCDWNYSLNVGGAFTKSGGLSTSYISTYDDYVTHQWSALSQGGTNDTVKALAVGVVPIAMLSLRGHYPFGPTFLLVGGVFDSAQRRYFPYLTWYGQLRNSPSILSGPVYAVATCPTYPNYDYAGGQFYSAFDSLFRVTEILNNVTELGIEIGGGIQNLTNYISIKAYPNPSSGQFTIQSSVGSNQLSVNSCQLEVYNELGQQVYINTIVHSSSFIVNLSAQPDGIYFCRVISADGNLLGEGKLVIEK